ncbi:TetR/AcrR family transcriptional regulator [Patulibacter minatonensis]|uniref:TetR/AcrR family transcriptional regulator n=1 Tax=Patulibacter minatonensis TaxID=298163 RepID=UPI0006878612|nr:TetR family transcriptional regulator [Patulibacter minatonensis]
MSTDAERELGGRVLPGAGLSVPERLAVEAAVPELKPRVREIVDVARVLMEEEGVAALSMRAIAGRVGIRAPSIYKHLPDKQAILDVLVADVLRENGDVLREAISGADDQLGALLHAFRRWALANPAGYELVMDGPLGDSPLVMSAALHSGDPLRWVMRDDLEGAIVLWAFAHGLTGLEISGRMPVPYDPEPVWAWGVERLRHPEDDTPTPAVPSVGPAAAAQFRAQLPDDVALTPRAAQIVAVARDLLEEEGEEGMSMRRIAARLGVRAPSLYKHLPDKQALENAIVASILDDQARDARDGLDRADAEGLDPLTTIVDGLYAWALEHPALHRLNLRGPLDPGPLVRSAEIRSAGPLLRACGGDGVAAVTIWAFLVGLLSLQINGRIPPEYELDAVRRRGVEALRPSASPADGA